MHERLARVSDPETMLAGLVAYAPVGFQIYTVDGHSLLTNAAFRELFGSEPPPEYNIFADQIIAEQGLLDLIKRAFAGEVVHTPTIWYDPRELKHVAVTEGKRVAIATTIFPLFSSEGRITHVAVVAKDETEIMAARERAEAERDHLREALDRAEAAERRALFLARAGEVLSRSLAPASAVSDLVDLLVPELADAASVLLVEADGSLRRVASAGRDESTRHMLQHFGSDPSSSGIEALARQVLEALEVKHIENLTAELTSRLPAGSAAVQAIVRVAPRHAIIAPLIARGRAVGVLTLSLLETTKRHYRQSDVLLASDLGRVAGLAIENARLYASAEEGLRAKDEFLALLGHELRNPLAPVLTAVELMKMKTDDQPQRELEIIERQSRNLVRLVDDLLDVSRIARGKISLVVRRLGIQEVIARAVEMATPVLEGRSQRLTLEVAEGIPDVDADEHRLAQVFANLLINAAKYSPPGSMITVDASSEDGDVLVAVRDEGEGIEPEILSRIFDLFVQGTRGLDRSEGGLGLGLAVAKRLVELHGGSITARSGGTGQGATFTVRLPSASAKTSRAEPEPVDAKRLLSTLADDDDR